MMIKDISAAFPYESHYVNVCGSRMHYIEQGSGDPILFLHGIPASSYVWRNVIPHMSTLGRCIALDLIGMGKSERPDIEYTVFDHIKYVENFIETLGLKNVTLVLHGWGSLMGFHYATHHEKNVKGLIFYEAYLRSFHDEDISLACQEQISLLEKQKQLSPVDFFDKMMSQGMLRALSQEEKKHYHDSFLEKNAEKPMLRYLQELSQRKKSNEIDQLIADYSKKLMQSRLPKLLLYSVPGFVMTMATLMWAKEHLPHLEMIDIGEALHYAQESDPSLMGQTMSVWLQGVEQLLQVDS